MIVCWVSLLDITVLTEHMTGISAYNPLLAIVYVIHTWYVQHTIVVQSGVT